MSEGRLDLDLHPAKALVIGGTSDIGRAVSLRLAQDGYEVIVQGGDAEYGDEIVKEILAGGSPARLVTAGLPDSPAMTRLVGDVGQIDVLVGIAAFPRSGLIAAFAPGMAALGGGRIINISTAADGPPAAAPAGRTGTREALEAMTRAWGVQLAGHGVRVHTVALARPAVEPALTDGADGAGSASLDDFAAPRQLGDLISLLTSAGASRLTGLTVVPGI